MTPFSSYCPTWGFGIADNPTLGSSSRPSGGAV